MISGNEKIVEILLASGAKVKDSKRRTALHWAAIYGRSGIAKILIDDCASLNLKDESGRTPLHLASETGKQNQLSLDLLFKTTDLFLNKFNF